MGRLLSIRLSPKVGILVAGFIATIIAAPVGAADPSGRQAPVDGVDSSATTEEAIVRALEADALAAGALGFYLDDRTSELVIVIPTSATNSFVTPSSQLAGGVRVEVRPIEQTDIDSAKETLRALAADSKLDWRYLDYYFDPAIGVVRATGNLDPAIVARQLGDFAPFVSYGQAPPALATSRWADYPPFWGGNRLSAGGSGCTGGFPVEDALKAYMLTAAHCYQYGAHVYSPGSGLEVGQVVRQRGWSVSSDMELLGNKTYEGRIYVGDLYAGTFQPVKGSAQPVIGGYYYCFSGYKSFEKCGYKVTSLDAHKDFFDDFGKKLGSADHVMIFRNSAGNAAPQGGDSGAPFYTYVSGGISARGMVNGAECPSVCNGLGFPWNQITTQLSVYITRY